MPFGLADLQFAEVQRPLTPYIQRQITYYVELLCQALEGTYALLKELVIVEAVRCKEIYNVSQDVLTAHRC